MFVRSLTSSRLTLGSLVVSATVSSAENGLTPAAAACFTAAAAGPSSPPRLVLPQTTREGEESPPLLLSPVGKRYGFQDSGPGVIQDRQRKTISAFLPGHIPRVYQV